MIGFIVTIFLSMFLTVEHRSEPIWIFKNFAYLFVMHGLVMLLMLGIMIFYIVYIFKSNLDQQLKILWTILIIIGGPIGTLVFWFINVWREPKPA